MVTRNGSNQIQRQSTPALTSTLNIYICYGQSNSSGVTATPPTTVSDTTYGAARVYGRDGRSLRDGTSSWCDISYVPAVQVFSGHASTQGDEPQRSHTREVFMFRAAEILNRSQIAATGERHRMQWICMGHTGYPFIQLDKGENAYTSLINAVTQMCANAVAASLTPVIRAVCWVHGEADFAPSGSGYAAALATLKNDLNTDLKAISGQAQNIPLVISQQSNFCTIGTSPGTILYPILDQLQGHIDNAGSVVLAGPMYAAENISTGNLHYVGSQVVRWANGFGNALSKLAVTGGTWEPIRPKTITRSGANVDIEFHVPTGSLVLDTTYASNTADGFYGFDFRQTGGSTTLQSVSLLNSTTVRFTLSGAPNGTSPLIRGGRNSTAAIAVAGPRTGARTCLRDSASAYPEACNWCVHFEIAVP